MMEKWGSLRSYRGPGDRDEQGIFLAAYRAEGMSAALLVQKRGLDVTEIHESPAPGAGDLPDALYPLHDFILPLRGRGRCPRACPDIGATTGGCPRGTLLLSKGGIYVCSQGDRNKCHFGNEF